MPRAWQVIDNEWIPNEILTFSLCIQLGSEDALSATGSDSTPLHNQQQHQLNTNIALTLTAEERIALLEKESAHWRAQYEVSKLNQSLNSSSNSNSNTNVDLSKTLMDASSICSCSTAAAGITVKPCCIENKSGQRARDSLQEPQEPPSKEQLIYSAFSKKYEELLRLKALAESRVRSFEQEILHLQICLENATQELKAKDDQVSSVGSALQMLEEELVIQIPFTTCKKQILIIDSILPVHDPV